MKKCILFGVVAVVMLWTGCSKKTKYSYLADKPLPVEIEVVGESSRMVTNTYVGEIRPRTDIALVFPFGGQLTGLFVKSGDRVKAGQLIATVDSTQAKAMLESAEAMYRQADDAWHRLQPLHDEGGISDLKWVEMETTLEKARSMVISARKRFDDCTMRATQDGIVNINHVDVGQYIGFGQPIGSLMDLTDYNVEFTVPENEVGQLAIGQSVIVTMPALGKQYEAQINEKSISSTRLAHNYRVQAHILSPEAKADLLPGMVCRAVITDKERAGYILSAGCIQTQQRGHSVWILRNGRAERRMVTIREFVENGVLITHGIELGDTVIAKGYQKMFNGAKVEF